MTTPSDDIAGLSERLRRNADDCENMARWATPELAPLLREAATQIDALSARVKELEKINAGLCRDKNDLLVDGAMLKSRALRAEQERDEAYERVAIYIEQREGHIPDWRGFVAELRCLASGPEKEG